jgi:hypothetical protein
VKYRKGFNFIFHQPHFQPNFSEQNNLRSNNESLSKQTSLPRHCLFWSADCADLRRFTSSDFRKDSIFVDFQGLFFESTKERNKQRKNRQKIQKIIVIYQWNFFVTVYFDIFVLIFLTRKTRNYTKNTNVFLDNFRVFSLFRVFRDLKKTKIPLIYYKKFRKGS